MATIVSSGVIFLFISILLSLIFYNDLSLESKQLKGIAPVTERYVSKDTNSLVQTLSDAVKFKTISNQDPSLTDYSELEKLHAFLKSSFPLIHQRLSRELIGNYTALYTWKGVDSDLLPIMIASHLDVVPIEAGTEQKWTHPPFSGTVADGFVWGRGTMDDKVAIIACLESIEDLLSKGFSPRRSVYLGFGHDEEVSGHNGAQQLAKTLESRGIKFEFILDEGMVIIKNALDMLPKPIAMIGVAEKGYLTLELSVETKGGHSSSPPIGLSSIGILSKAITTLETSPIPMQLDITRNFLNYIASEASFPSRLLLSNLWLFEPVLTRILSGSPASNALLRSTTAVTIFNAGMKENVLPSKASAIVNFRIMPPDSPASVMEYVKSVVKDERISYRVLDSLEAAPVSPTDTESFKTLQTTVHQLFPEAIVAPSIMIANTDTRHYWNLSKSIYRFLPLQIFKEEVSRIHGTDERISIENYLKIIEFYSLLIRNVDKL